MTTHTLFISPIHSIFHDNVINPSESKDYMRFMSQERHNILYHKIEKYELDLSATRAISFANYTTLSDWAFIIAKVVGSVRINTAGFDTDGVTARTGKLPIYGTSIVPGIGIISTYNTTSFTVESLANDSTIELYAAIAAEDDDTRMDSNV